MPKLKSTPEAAQRAPGAFMLDGSWKADAEPHDRDRIHQLVAALVRERRSGHLTPRRAAQMIQTGNTATAFPNHGQWAHAGGWPTTWTSTAAEEAVKREGRGTDGHWSGQRWGGRPERDWLESRPLQAWPKPVAAELDAIRGLTARVGSAGPVKHRT